MPVDRTSPDGSQKIERLEVAGRGYDLPPWISAAEFEGELASLRDTDPLSSLIACELASWVENEDYDPDEPDECPAYFPLFALTWFIPFGAVRELVAGAFTPTFPEDPGAREMFSITFTAEGAEVRGYGYEYRDINDVQVALMQQPVEEFTYVPRGGGDPDWDYLEDWVEEFKADPEGYIAERVGYGIDGQVAEHIRPDGTDWLLVLNHHED